MNSIASSKEQILANIRKNKPEEQYNYPHIPDFPKSREPLLDAFKRTLVEGGGTWHELKSKAEAESLLRELHPDAKVICSASPDLPGNRDLSQVTDPHQLEDVDVGIIRARFGVAENGMVWMTDSDLQVNALGFLSQHLVILLEPDQLVRDMYEAYNRIKLDEMQYGCFMLGPSATADIGAVMVHGAQGARTLAVFLL